MAVTDWPTGLPDPFVNFQDTWSVPVVSSPMETGVVKDRLVFTTESRYLTVQFTHLTWDQKEDIEAFFYSIGWGAGTIKFTHPGDSSTIYVRLEGDITFQSIGLNKWATVMRFKRIPDALAL